MQVTKKISLITICLSIFFILAFAITLKIFSTNSNIKNYEKNIVSLQVFVNKMFSFAEQILNYGTEIDIITPEWNSIFTKAKTTASFCFDSKTKKYPQNVTNQIEQLSSIWDDIENLGDELSQIYTSFNSIGLPTVTAKIISQNGLNYAIQNYPDIDILKQYKIKINSIKNINIQLQKLVSEYSDLSDLLLENIEKENTKILSNFMIYAIVGLVVLAIILIFCSMKIISKLFTPFTEIQKSMKKIAAKDFSSLLNTSTKNNFSNMTEDFQQSITEMNSLLIYIKDFISNTEKTGFQITDSSNKTEVATKNINTSVTSITNTTTKLSNSATQVLETANQLKTISELLNQNNTDQTNTILQNQNIVSDMAHNLNIIATKADEKAIAAQKIQNLVENGDEKIYSTYTLLQDINNQLDEITEIVTIINDIAEQTNILSMNAAIESAHAGDAGKGFGVVAEEIRQLAESTADNATRISSSLFSIISIVKDANTTSKAAAEAFQLVNEQTKEMATSLTEISSNIKEIDNTMFTITDKNQNLSDNTKVITDYCNKLTQNQEELSANVDSINNLSNQLKKNITSIKSDSSKILSEIQQINLNNEQNCNNVKKFENTIAEYKICNEMPKQEYDNAQGNISSDNKIIESSSSINTQNEKNDIPTFENSIEEVSITENPMEANIFEDIAIFGNNTETSKNNIQINTESADETEIDISEFF